MNVEERDKLYLLRMLEYCDRIEQARKRFGDSLEYFVKDPDYRDVVCMNIFQIGELAHQISEETRSKLDDLP